MQSLCCHAEHESQQIMSRSTSSSSSYSPHIHRMISSSSPSLGPGVGSAEALDDLSFESDLDFDFFMGVSVTISRFLCWPFVARPDRRGSSVHFAVSTVFHQSAAPCPRPSCHPVLATSSHGLGAETTIRMLTSHNVNTRGFYDA